MSSITPDREFTQGTTGIKDTVPLLTDGEPVPDLESADSITLILQGESTHEIDCAVADSAAGTVDYTLTSAELENSGVFYGQFKIVWSDKTIYIPDPGYLIYHIQESLRSDSYCTPYDVYRRAGVGEDISSWADVENYITASDDRIDSIFKRSFKANQIVTEWKDIEDLDEDEVINTIFLDNYPVKSITSLEEYDAVSSTAAIVWAASDYWLDNDIGRIRLRIEEFAHQNHRVKVVYVYGPDEVPGIVKDLSAVIAAMSVLINQIGGTYDDVTSYSLPSGVSVSVGEPYMNMLRDIDELRKERDDIIKRMGKTRIFTPVI
jgi:methyl-accepting chemotaxis protein